MSYCPSLRQSVFSPIASLILFFCNMTYFYPNQYCKMSHITTLNTFAYLANHAPMSVESFGPSARYMIPPRNMDIPWPMAAIALIHVLSA